MHRAGVQRLGPGVSDVAVRTGAGKELAPEVLGENYPKLVRFSGADHVLVCVLRVIVLKQMRRMIRMVAVNK
jgi:hypothetical protein